MDTQIQALITGEYHRQQHELELIASENYVSKAVMDAYANVFTNKYSEGYPSKRYYGGQQWVDKLERVCQWRALEMFHLHKKSDEPFDKKLRVTDEIRWSVPIVKNIEEPDTMTEGGYAQLRQDLKDADRAVNVQPLSGSPANLAVYLWCLEPGDTILGMDLDAGGHLTHGHPLNASWKCYQIVSYGVEKETERLDYAQVMSQALEHKPKLILAWFSAYSRKIDWAKFVEVADAVEKKHRYRPLLMVDMAHVAGLIAGGVYPDPFPHVDIVTTTTHKTLRWPRWWLIYMKKGKLARNGKEINLVAAINRGLFPGMQGGPHEHIIAAKAVAFGEILWAESWKLKAPSQQTTGFDMSWEEYAQKVVSNTQNLSQALIDLWWNLVSGWTDNHLLMIDVTKKWSENTGIWWKIAEKTLEKIWISVNKNMIPFDQRSPMDPSGLRIGTPAITTRGLGGEEMKQIAELIDLALIHHDDDLFLAGLKAKVQTICEKFPLWY